MILRQFDFKMLIFCQVFPVYFHMVTAEIQWYLPSFCFVFNNFDNSVLDFHMVECEWGLCSGWCGHWMHFMWKQMKNSSLKMWQISNRKKLLCLMLLCASTQLHFWGNIVLYSPQFTWHLKFRWKKKTQKSIKQNQKKMFSVSRLKHWYWKHDKSFCFL